MGKNSKQLNNMFPSVMCYDPWLSTKERKWLAHVTNLELQTAAMFECDNMSRQMFRQVERCFLRYGMCTYTVFDSGLHYADIATLQGEINEWGFGSEGYIITRNGKQTKKGKIDEDIIIGWNNDELTPCFDLYNFADLLTEIDTSTRVNVINARLHKMPVAKDEKQRQMITTALKNMKNGETDTVINALTLNDLAQEVGAMTGIETLSLTEVDDIQNVQYLSKLYDDIIARWWNMYGHDMQSTGKMAQQTTVELAGYESYSMITPENMLKNRVEWIEKVNERFGTNYKYHFSPAWSWAMERKNEKYHVNGMYDESAEEKDIEDTEVVNDDVNI